MVGQGQRENYSTAANLRRRQAIFDFIDPTRSWGRPAVERIAWTGHERVLDAGCGNGIWIGTLEERFSVRDVIGVDLSVGMLGDAQKLVGPGVALAAADVGRDI
jgi:trans-aconitate methyltransferase